MKATKSIFGVLRITLGLAGRICTSSLGPLLLLLWILPAVVQAQSFTNSYGIWYYTTTDDSITITGYGGPGGDVTIPDRIPDTTSGLPVTSIGDYAFAFCGSLTNVSIPDNVTNIGSSAFYICIRLTSVTIGNSVANIGNGAFEYCFSLASVTIPSSVTNIGDDAFWGCGLGGVFFQGNAPSIGSDVFGPGATVYYLAGTTGWVSTFAGCPTILWNPQVPYEYTTNNGAITLTGYIMGYPNSVSPVVMIMPSTINGLPVTSIGQGAFERFTSLTSVTIGTNVTSIAGFAFFYCTNLTSITIPNSVTNIGSLALAGCTSLTAITVDALNSVYSDVDGVLFNKSLTTLLQYPEGLAGGYTIPNCATSIGRGAFEDCTRLSGVTIGTNVTSIEAGAFDSCRSLTNVTIPNSVTNIDSVAFAGCTSLTAITVDALNSVYRDVDGVLFNKSQSTLLQYPGGVAGGYTIPYGVTNVGDYAFIQCEGLTSVTIPKSVTSIGDGAFGACGSLTNVTIPKNVTSIGERAFVGCTSLTAITVDTNNPAYSSVAGVLFNKSQTTLVQYPGGKAGTSYTIPKSVASIGDYAFWQCTSLTNLTIGNSVTSIADYAFGNCHSLTSVVIPDRATSIGEYAFSGCSSLTSVTIGNSVTSIGDGAFVACGSLTNVTIPNSVTNIEDDAFYYCTSLTALQFGGNAPSLGGASVFASDNNATVYYLPGTTGWSATFGGRPTTLWYLPNPLILNNGPNFGVETNGFGFIISWATNIPVVVEACTNPANHSWSPVGTNILNGGWSYFSDPQWKNYPAHFYRLRSLSP